MSYNEFRAWDHRYDKFLYKGFYDRNWYTEDDKCVKALMPECQHYQNLNNFTRSKDMVDKKIYEGDIVKWYGNFFINQPIPEYSLHRISWCDEMCYFALYGIDIKDENGEPSRNHLNMQTSEQIEVVGNLYETPKLAGVQNGL